MQSAKLDRAYLVMMAFLTAWVVPLFILSNNIVDFRHLNVSVVLAAMVATLLALTGLLLLIRKLAERIGIAQPFNTAVRLSFFFLLLAGLVLPLSGEAGQVEINRIPTNRMNLAIALVGALVLLTLSLWKTRDLIRVLSIAILGFSVVGSAIPVAAEAFGSNAGPESIRKASKTRNIFVLSFDGLSSALTVEAIKEHADLQLALKDFDVFENVASASPATFASITAETSGDRNLQEEFGSQQAIMDDMHKGEIVSNALAAEGYIVSTYGTYGRMIEDLRYDQPLGSLGAKKTLLGDLTGAAELYDYALARMITPRLVFASNVALPVIESIPLIAPNDSPLEAAMVDHKGENWDKINLLGLTDFKGYVDHLEALEDAPVAHFMHFLHTHYPIDLDENCIYRSNNAEWFNSNQNRNGAKNEGLCALRQMAEFLSHLREIGVYDNSMVILKSDHGQPVVYNDPTKIESFTVRGHPSWGYARYTPFLAIKGFDADRDRIEFDARPAILSDLARTICNAAALKIECTIFPGYDLVQKDRIPDGATYVINIVKDSQSSFKIDDHESVVLERSSDFPAALHRRLTLEILGGQVSCDSRFTVNESIAFNNGYSDYSTWATWSDQSSTFVMVRAGCTKLIVGIGLPTHATPTVYMDGEPMAVSFGAGPGEVQVPLSPASSNGVLLEFRGAEGTEAPNVISLALSDT